MNSNAFLETKGLTRELKGIDWGKQISALEVRVYRSIEICWKR